MFVELIFDKRNVQNIPHAHDRILHELIQRVSVLFPDAEVSIKPMQQNSLRTDASKSDREKLNRLLEEMFEEADIWLLDDPG